MNKKLIMFGVPILAIALVAAVVLIANLDTTVTVSEAFDVVSESVVLEATAGNPNELCEQSVPIEITNLANWDLWAGLTYTETISSGVVYTTNMDTTLPATLGSGQNFVNVCFEVAEDSPLGIVEGTVTIERVAQP